MPRTYQRTDVPKATTKRELIITKRELIIWLIAAASVASVAFAAFAFAIGPVQSMWPVHVGQ